MALAWIISRRMKFLQGKIYTQMKNIRQINKIEEFRKIKKTFFPQLFFFFKWLWSLANLHGGRLPFTRKAQCYITVVHFFCFCFFLSQTSASNFLTVNKMHCKYVILLIIYIQKTITLQRRSCSCSVWNIKDRRHTSVNGWIPENINMPFSFCLACIYGLWRDGEKEAGRISELLGKNAFCLYFYSLRLNHIFGQCTFAMKCIRI